MAHIVKIWNSYSRREKKPPQNCLEEQTYAIWLQYFIWPKSSMKL